jgi:hypothetical protein
MFPVGSGDGLGAARPLSFCAFSSAREPNRPLSSKMYGSNQLPTLSHRSLPSREFGTHWREFRKKLDYLLNVKALISRLSRVDGVVEGVLFRFIRWCANLGIRDATPE